MQFRKSRPEIGSRPGTLAIPEGSPPPKIAVVRYDQNAAAFDTVEDPGDLGALIGGEGTCWVDVQGLGDESILREIGRQFRIEPLALEDAVNVPQRAKSESYTEFQLVIARAMLYSDEVALQVPQVCFLIGRNWLLTFQERYFGLFEPVRERLRAGVGPIRSLGPDYLAYAMIDTMIDGYYPLAEHLAERLDEIEDRITEDPTIESLAEIHDIRRQLILLRRIGRPQREAIKAMVREDSLFITPEVRKHLRDTDDHISQIMELVDSSREMTSTLSEIYLANVSQRTNDIMKVLTLMASIFIPLTFIAGIYGMNFDYMPELGRRGSCFVVLLIMASVAATMLFYFRRRGWVGRRKSGK